jgi:hypothetical protein
MDSHKPASVLIPLCRIHRYGTARETPRCELPPVARLSPPRAIGREETRRRIETTHQKPRASPWKA